jgi:hypothetical protein
MRLGMNSVIRVGFHFEATSRASGRSMWKRTGHERSALRGQTIAINLILEATPSEAILVTTAALERGPIPLIEILVFLRCQTQPTLMINLPESLLIVIRFNCQILGLQAI